MIILAIDTSAITASVSLFDGDKIIGEFFTNTGLTHSQTVMPMLESLLKNAQMDINDVDAFAVNVGPGSFTGLRIGVACVKGLAMALNKPCIPVSTLECIAYNGMDFDGILCSVMDARCGQVYNALFKSENGKLLRLCDDRAITIEQLKNELENTEEKIYLLGDGAFVSKKILTDTKYIVPSVQNIYQKASSTAICAYNSQNFTDAEKIMPLYLRLPQAQRELNNKLNNKNNGG